MAATGLPDVKCAEIPESEPRANKRHLCVASPVRLFKSEARIGQLSPANHLLSPVRLCKSETRCAAGGRNGAAWLAVMARACTMVVGLLLWPCWAAGQIPMMPNVPQSPSPAAGRDVSRPASTPVAGSTSGTQDVPASLSPAAANGWNGYAYPGVRPMLWPMPGVLSPVLPGVAPSGNTDSFRGSPYFMPRSPAQSVPSAPGSPLHPGQTGSPAGSTSPWLPPNIAAPGSDRIHVPPAGPQLRPPASSPDKPSSPDSRSSLRRQQFDPMQVQLRQEKGRWQLLAGQEVLKDFGYQETEAMFALHVIRYYRLNERITVGEKDTGIEFWLSFGQAPRGRMPGQQTITFAPQQLRVIALGHDYWITDGRYRYFRFRRAEDAEQAIAIIQRYGFTQVGVIGRPQPIMLYWLAD
jgi:hypothetical protein